MTFPKLKLTYFDMTGRAEAARLAFFIGGIPFEDDRMQREDMAKRKHEFPYGVVPVLQVDDEVLAESSAIALYAGRLAGLYPTNNPLAAIMVDEIMQAIEEFGEAFRPWYTATDPAVKQEVEAELLKETVPRYFAQIDARLAKMKEHVTFQDDSRLFIHELWIYTYLTSMLQSDWLGFVPNDLYASYEQWLALEKKVSGHPRVIEWYAVQPTRPKKLKLSYFGFGGRAEPIRLAFHVGGIDFEDNRISDREAFLKLKPSLPYGQVPTLEIDDKVTIAQSYAILRYAGRLADLYPTTGNELLALRIDELLSVLDELHNVWFPYFKTQDAEKKRSIGETLTKETLPKFLGGLDKRVKGWAKPYATGTKFTIADLAIFGVVDFLRCGMMKHVPVDLVDGFPSLAKVHALVREMPSVQDYYEGKQSQP